MKPIDRSLWKILSAQMIFYALSWSGNLCWDQKDLSDRIQEIDQILILLKNTNKINLR